MKSRWEWEARASRLRQKGNGEEQGMTVKVTVEDVERVAELAHLQLAPEETPRMLHDLNAILDYVAEPVSYTHLDVYKRQGQHQLVCER